MGGDTTILETHMTHIPPHLLKTGWRTAVLAAVLAATGASAQTVGVTVTTTPTTTTTTAAPRQDFATNIAKASLAKEGITNPTSAQLGLATSNVQGMRDAGMGWGAIANSLGVRLGDAVSEANQARKAVDARAASTDKAQKSAKTPTARSDRSTVAAASASTGVGGQGSGKGGGKGGGNGGGSGGGGGGGGGVGE
jgi:uncharacterized membrane protein YgcG